MRVTLHRGETLAADERTLVRRAALGPLLRGAGDALGVSARAGLAVRLTDDHELHHLNRAHRGTDAVTDVLAFVGDDPGWVGDIAISVPRARLQRADDPAAELRLLAIHGLLHCLGHDHEDAVGAAAMTTETQRLLPGDDVPVLAAP
ncbi:MAG: rRNA maturation RNase YbeY [Candidatus Dormibacteria bacterium]